MEVNSTHPFQVHKYKNGHQLLTSNVTLDRNDQDTVDRLSDISGQVRPGELFDPYFTCYPLPSKKYFVIARTWQDLLAPRAGCVVTKSLVIPIEKWVRFDNISILFQELKFPPIAINSNVESRQSHFNDKTIDAPVQEIVEALFLEQRKPVLIFDCKSADSIIYRLYTAFWPGMRGSFAACTFALSPRTVSGRSFDLIFSKNDLRSRFVDWPGRRIEGTPNLKRPPRHRWTSELADRIFESEFPSLFSESSDMVFHFTGMDDESKIRLRLLWEELFQKARLDGSPFAVLGLLDIINSQKVFESDLYAHVQPLIYNAIDVARHKLNANEAWKFYAAILIKHKKKMMTRDMLYAVRESCTQLCYKEPYQGFEYFKDNDNSGKILPAMLYASFGDGISENEEVFNYIIDGFMPKTGLLLIATSKLFAQALMKYYLSNSSRIYPFLENALFSADLKYRNGAKTNLAYFSNREEHEGVVKILLEGNSIQHFQKLIKIIGKGTGFSIRQFDDLILKETRTLKQEEFLLETVIHNNTSKDVSLLIVDILIHSPQLISTFFDDYRIEKASKHFIALNLFSNLSIDVISSLEIDLEIKRGVVEQMLSNETFTQKAAVLIFDVGFKHRQIINLMTKLGENAINLINANTFAESVYKNIHNTTKQDIVLISGIIGRMNYQNTEVLIESLFEKMAIDNRHFVKVFVILMNAGETAIDILANHIDVVTRYFYKLLNENVDQFIIDSWLNLFDRSNRYDRVQDASLLVLEFAYKTSTQDPSKLLLKVFPIIYNSFLLGRTLGQYISFIFFPDWDKCRTLRIDLVERYKHSSWSRFGLLEVATKAGIIKDVVGILNDSKNGKSMIVEAMEEAASLKVKSNHPGLLEISKLDKKKKNKKKNK